MKIESNPKFLNCVKLAIEAKIARGKEFSKEADYLESQAVTGFREVREETLKQSSQEKAELISRKESITHELKRLADSFCEQKGEHTYITHSIEKQVPIEEHGFHLYDGDAAKHIKYKRVIRNYHTCLICGTCNLPRAPKVSYQSGSEAVIQEASQSENIGLKKIAIKIIELNKELNEINQSLKDVTRDINELCLLFGHDANIPNDNEEFTCNCCGKKDMDCTEYISAHYSAKYKGIVPFYYFDDSIL